MTFFFYFCVRALKKFQFEFFFFLSCVAGLIIWRKYLIEIWVVSKELHFIFLVCFFLWLFIHFEQLHGITCEQDNQKKEKKATKTTVIKLYITVIVIDLTLVTVLKLNFFFLFGPNNLSNSKKKKKLSSSLLSHFDLNCW